MSEQAAETKKELTWEEIAEKPVGEILHDEMRDGVRFIVMRGPASLCGYAGVPENHPAAGHSYDDVCVQAHGGLTFSAPGGPGRGIAWPEGFWWYGWDYAHAEDYCFYYDKPPLADLHKDRIPQDKKWLVKDVVNDSWGTLYEKEKFMRLAKKIANKARG